MIASRQLLTTLSDSLTRKDPIDIAYLDGDGEGPWFVWAQPVTAIDAAERTFKLAETSGRFKFDDILQTRRTIGPPTVGHPYEKDEDNPSVVRVRALPNWREPEIGDTCVVGSSLYIDHGWDDFRGGVATIKAVEHNWLCTNAFNRLMVTLEERPGWSKNWYAVIEQEERNREVYGDARAHEDPEYHWLHAPHGKR